MPIVPKIGERVRESRIPNIRVGTSTPKGAFGGDTRVGSEASKLGNLAFNIALEEKKKADDTMLMNSSSELDNIELEALRERQKHLGENALSYPDKEKEFVNKRIEEISSKLYTDRQKKEFVKLANNTRFNIEKQTIQHVDREKEVFQRNSYISGINNKKNLLLNKYRDERDYSDVSRSLLEMAEYTNRYIGERYGKEKAKEEINKITSDVHSGIILKLAEKSETAALDYFEKRKDGLLPEDRIKVKNDISILSEKRKKEFNIRNAYGEQKGLEDVVSKISDTEQSYVEKRQIIESYYKTGILKDSDYKFVKKYLDSQNNPDSITYDNVLSDIALKIDEVNGGLEIPVSKDIKKKDIKEKALPYLKKVKDLRMYLMDQKSAGRLNQYDFDRLMKNLNDAVIDEEQLITNKIKKKGNYKFKESYEIFLKNYNGNIIKADDAFKQFYYAVAENPEMNNLERSQLREKIINDITEKYNNLSVETLNTLNNIPKELRQFNTPEEADNSGLPNGTIVKVGNRRYEI